MRPTEQTKSKDVRILVDMVPSRALGLHIHNSPSISAMAAPAPDSDFAKDLRDLHLVYDYNVQDAHGNPDKWRYEIWFFSEVCEVCVFVVGLRGNAD